MAEKVHGVVGYYDGILEGVADFMGKPHAFVVDGDRLTEEPRYRLKPLTTAEFALFWECWLIWRRWEVAVERGDVDGTVDADQQRHEELDPQLQEVLMVPAKCGDRPPRALPAVAIE